MAKYQINFKCGHTGEEILFGKSEARRKRIAWLEENKECVACWKAANRNNEDLPLITARILKPYEEVEIIYTGNTFPVKDELRAWGYSFGEFVLDGSLGVAFTPTGAVNTAVKGWSKVLSWQEAKDALAWLKGEGYKIEVQAGMSVAASAVIEGKPEYLKK